MYEDVLKQFATKREQTSVPFDRLMPRRVRNVLIVSSLYDSFTVEEDGRLSESLFSDYLELNLRYAPHLDRVSTAHNALERLEAERYDLVVSMLRVGDMTSREFCRQARKLQPGLPVIFLTFSAKELAIVQSNDLSHLERIFMWRGDARLFLAMIKTIEDNVNVEFDSGLGVPVLLVVEDSVRFYSSYLPMIYTEIMQQTRSLMSEGANRAQQLLRMHARPKILLATTYEEALSYYNQYQDHLLGVIVDAGFPRNGELDPVAGHKFATMVKEEHPDRAVMVQSSDSANAEFAQSIGAAFINKRSPSLLHELREFMQAQLGFGDFVFRRPDGSVVTTASDLRTMADSIKIIPEESLLHHGRRKDFSTWLMARTEFALAKAIRLKKMSSFPSPDDFRDHLINSLKVHRSRSREGIVADFSSDNFEGGTGFVKIGGGSVGGKGRGLAFFNSLLTNYDIHDHVDGIRLFLPPTAVVATEIFDTVMESEKLTDLALGDADNQTIDEAFAAIRLPEEVREALRTFLARVRYPLAVRSSSLLEDASYQPFAGVYGTYMIPNNEEQLEDRLMQLANAIKLVYASTFHSEAKAYLASTPNRLEEEKMAVVIQEIVGNHHGEHLYPDLAGVARSHNFYPIGNMTPGEGVVCAVLGLGRSVVEGGRCIRFSPKNPKGIYDMMRPRDFMLASQREFWALEMDRDQDKDAYALSKSDLVKLELDKAAEHGTLNRVASTYAPTTRTLTDGGDGSGVKLVTLAGLLKDQDILIGEALSFLLNISRTAFSWPVEIEFALKLNRDGSGPHELGFLQVRPMTVTTSEGEVHEIPREQTICSSRQSLGPGRIEPVHDLVYVRKSKFNRAITPEIAEEVGLINDRIKEEDRNYVLIGPGRWGSTDWRLGIPVTWGQISKVNCLVETELEGLKVNPSQGSHFFHNITSFGVGCLSVNFGTDGGFIDNSWLEEQHVHYETEHVRHIRFDSPIQVLVDGQTGYGVVLKPSIEHAGPRVTLMPRI